MYFHTSMIVCFLSYCISKNHTSRVSDNTSMDEQKVYKSRILGGKLTLIEAYPYNVFIDRLNKVTCGGAILGPSHVITAGQCYDSQLTVYVGSDRKFLGKRIKVKKYDRHPEYSEHINSDGSMYISYNLMMLELEEMVTPYGPSIQPIVLANMNDYPEGDLAILTGYGNTASVKILPGAIFQNVEGENTRLHEVSPQIVYSAQFLCIRVIRDLGIQCSFCAGSGNKERAGCVGDTGSPLVYHNKLIGVLSRGLYETNCEKGIQLYAKVPCAAGWINSFLKK